MPPPYIMPDPQLVSHGIIDADWLEPQRFMQSNTGGVGQSDPRVGIVESLEGENREE